MLQWLYLAAKDAHLVFVVIIHLEAPPGTPAVLILHNLRFVQAFLRGKNAIRCVEDLQRSIYQ